MGVRTGLLAGDPLARPVGSGQAAIEGRSELPDHEWALDGQPCPSSAESRDGGGELRHARNVLPSLQAWPELGELGDDPTRPRRADDLQCLTSIEGSAVD